MTRARRPATAGGSRIELAPYFASDSTRRRIETDVVIARQHHAAAAVRGPVAGLAAAAALCGRRLLASGNSRVGRVRAAVAGATLGRRAAGLAGRPARDGSPVGPEVV